MVAEAKLTEEDARLLLNGVFVLEERMAELELALEDANWIRQEGIGESNRDFSRDAINRLVMMSRLMTLKSPLIKRSVEIQRDYVWALGVNIVAKDKRLNEFIQRLIADPINQTEFFGHQARNWKEVELQTDGNLFFVFFTSPDDGLTRFRTLPVDEITEVIANPEDSREPWFYRRVWTITDNDGLKQTQQEALYPDFCFRPKELPEIFRGARVKWDSPVYHIKTGGFSWMKFGVPELYAAFDWAKAHKEFLEDWASIVKAYRRFAWAIRTKGGAPGVAAMKEKLQTTLSLNSPERKPAPVTGSALLSSDSTTVEPLRTQGATVGAEDGRLLLLQVASAAGFAESFYGDVSVGNLATARSLDRPTELKMRSRQELWRSIITMLLLFAIDQAVRLGKLKGIRGVQRVIRRSPYGDLREYLVYPASLDRRIDTTFPDILERDVDARTRAIMQAEGMNVIDHKTIARLVLEALGIPNSNELVNLLYPDDEETYMPATLGSAEPMIGGVDDSGGQGASGSAGGDRASSGRNQPRSRAGKRASNRQPGS